MAKTVLENDTDPERRKLAKAIIAAQEVKIAWIIAWITDWLASTETRAKALVQRRDPGPPH